MAVPSLPRSEGPLLPIRSLATGHRGRIAAHLLALDAEDRHLRFGYFASDTQVRRYVEQLDFERDELFGIFNRKREVIALAHLAILRPPGAPAGAEFGGSVLPKARGRGFGARLFDRAIMHAREQGVELVFIHALSGNAAMLKIARNAGASLERQGGETAACLRLPPSADARRAGLAEEEAGQRDPALPKRGWSFADFLADMKKPRPDDTASPRKSGA